MSNNMVQCSLTKGTLNTVTYIDADHAKVGKSVELIEEDGTNLGFWKVVSVADKSIPKSALKAKQNMDRKGFASIS